MAASFFAAYATSFSVFFLLTQYKFSSVFALNLAVLFILAIFFKEYAKMQTSNDDGYFSNSGRIPVVASMFMSISIAVFCAIGLETLFIVSLWISIKNMTGLSQEFKTLICMGSVMLAVLNMPIDLLFYWNCLRKWFKTNSDISEQKVGQRGMLKLLRGSLFISSVFYAVRAMFFLYYFIPNFARIHLFIFCLVAGLIGCIIFQVNRLLMAQTIAEVYRQVPVIPSLFSFSKVPFIHVMALVYSLLFTLPSIFMFQESHIFSHVSKGGAMFGMLGIGGTILFSFYLLNKNYLVRFYQATRLA